MKPPRRLTALILVSSAVLGGCASTGQSSYAQPQNNASSYGAIESIEAPRGTSGTSGAGAIIGGVLGAVVGNQVGGGNGRNVAIAAGAVGGAVAGNAVEGQRNANSAQLYQIRVHLDDGASTTVTQDSIYDLRVGNRVHIVDGRAYRY